MKIPIINHPEDIETAFHFDSYTNKFPPDDLRYLKETLFYTASGKWYLFSNTGHLSKISQLCLSFIPPSLKIFPLTSRDAFSWIVSHSDIDKLREFSLHDSEHPQDS